MSYTLIDYFNGFQDLKRKKSFSAGVQSAYFSILAEFNLQRFPASLTLSTRELKLLAGLKSVSSAQEARNILKNNRLIDFHTGNGTTVYKLCTEHLPNTNRTLTEHHTPNQPNTYRTPRALSSSLSVSPPVETETGEESYSNNTNNSAGASTQRLDGLLEYWQDELHGGRLTFEHQSKLASYFARYGFYWLKTAMCEAANGNTSQYGISPKFLFAVIKRKENAPLKGGEKHAEYPEADPRGMWKPPADIAEMLNA